MKTLKTSVLLVLLASVCGVVFAQNKIQKWQLPYHPYRKVGEKYYSVQPIYNWIKSGKTSPGADCPMPGWFLADSSSYGRGAANFSYKVIGVKEDGLIIGQESSTVSGGQRINEVLFLKNHPNQLDWFFEDYSG